MGARLPGSGGRARAARPGAGAGDRTRGEPGHREPFRRAPPPAARRSVRREGTGRNGDRARRRIRPGIVGGVRPYEPGLGERRSTDRPRTGSRSFNAAWRRTKRREPGCGAPISSVSWRRRWPEPIGWPRVSRPSTEALDARATHLRQLFSGGIASPSRRTADRSRRPIRQAGCRLNVSEDPARGRQPRGRLLHASPRHRAPTAGAIVGTAGRHQPEPSVSAAGASAPTPGGSSARPTIGSPKGMRRRICGTHERRSIDAYGSAVGEAPEVSRTYRPERLAARPEGRALHPIHVGGRSSDRPANGGRCSCQFLIPGDVGFAGEARFFEKNGSTLRSIRSPTLLVWSPSYSS